MNLKELKEKYHCVQRYDSTGIDVRNKEQTELIGHIELKDMPKNETDDIKITPWNIYEEELKESL